MGGTIIDYEARRISIDAFIEGMLAGNASEDSIIAHIISKYQLTMEAAKEAFNRVNSTH